MEAVIVGLQFFAVALPALVGIIWIGSAAVKAWNTDVSSGSVSIVLTGAIGVFALAVAVAVAVGWGWIA